MSKLRHDAWSQEEDVLLKDTVLNNIQSGDTQLKAFEEVARHIHRTPAACGFRWNKELRQHYVQEITEAKCLRQNSKEAADIRKNTNYSDINHSSELIETCLSSILQHTIKQQHLIESQYATIDKLTEENQKLAHQFSTLEAKLKMVEEDYQTFITIMERARKMVVLDSTIDQTHFMMDKNGNLQSIAK